MNAKEEIKNVPVSAFLGVTLIVVFSLYFSSMVKTVPCGVSVKEKFASNFIHTDMYHLISNLYALYSLSRIEVKLGPKKFFTLILFSLVLNTIAETAIHTAFPSVPCGIGFSGVLFSVITWEMVTEKKLDLFLLVAIAGMVILPSLHNKKASLYGHAIGAATGIVAGSLFNKIYDNQNII